jgi:acyl-CoA synthetase (NDP forming)
MGYIGNPLDPWGAAEESLAYRVSFEALAASGAYDVLAVVHDNPFRDLPSEVDVARTVSRALIDATAGRPELLPVYVSLTSNDVSDEVKAFLDAEGGMPMLKGAVEAFAAIARLAAWEVHRAGRDAAGPRRPGWPALAADPIAWGIDTVLDPLAMAAARGAPIALPERASLQRLSDAGIAVTAWRAVDAAPDAAIRAWRELGGGPVAIKLDAPSLAHKSDAGGVALSLTDEAGITGAVHDLAVAAARSGVGVRGLLVEPMAAPGVELIVGGRRDPVFGPVVLVGLGGILAEVLDDVAVLLAPVHAVEVEAGLAGLRGSALLRGVRGADAVDVGAIVTLVVALGDLLVADPTIVEIDLNPVIAGLRGAVAVDALVVVDAGA